MLYVTDLLFQDAAVGYRQYHEALLLEFSPEEVSYLKLSKRSKCTNLTSTPQVKRVRWKIDFIVLPIFLVTQALQFMDRTALNYANLFNYQKALGLKGQQFNYLSASKCPQVAQVKPN